jgi:hypothetical protein
MTTMIFTLPLSQETFDELTLLLGVDPTRFADPELAEELQADIDQMMELAAMDGQREPNLLRALTADIETGLVTLASLAPE